MAYREGTKGRLRVTRCRLPPPPEMAALRKAERLRPSANRNRTPIHDEQAAVKRKPEKSSAEFRIAGANAVRQTGILMKPTDSDALLVDWRQIQTSDFSEPSLGAPRTLLDRGHAVFAIAGHLRALGLRSWVGRVVQWLSRYDGLEDYVEPEDEPLVCVRDVLVNHVCRLRQWIAETAPGQTAAETLSQLKNRIIDDLLTLNFVSYAAFWGHEPVPTDKNVRWKPLQQSWLEFLEARQEGDHLWIWQRSDGPNPSGAALREYLLHES